MTPDDTLRALYPFIHDVARDETALDAALLDSIGAKAAASIETKRRFFADNAASVLAVARAIADSYQRGGRLLAMGNGGSSCDSAHIAVEFLHPVTAGRQALPAINLAADTAMMSAVGNDVGYAHVFVRQVIAYGRPGDVLVGVSTSGNSANLLAAFAKARELGITTIGLSGHDGGEMGREGALDHCLTVASDSIHRVQETQVAIYHVVWDLVHTLLANQRGKAPPTGGTGA